jgi:hypothetical protein
MDTQSQNENKRLFYSWSESGEGREKEGVLVFSHSENL